MTPRDQGTASGSYPTMSETSGSFDFNGQRIVGRGNHPPDGWKNAQAAADKWDHETAPEWLVVLVDPNHPPIRLKAKDEQQAKDRYAEVIGLVLGIPQPDISVSLYFRR
jgi:hypothetical protein